MEILPANINGDITGNAPPDSLDQRRAMVDHRSSKSNT
jgi:hypothetical protein